jgi:hypothetical protein
MESSSIELSGEEEEEGIGSLSLEDFALEEATDGGLALQNGNPQIQKILIIQININIELTIFSATYGANWTAASRLAAISRNIGVFFKENLLWCYGFFYCCVLPSN